MENKKWKNNEGKKLGLLTRIIGRVLSPAVIFYSVVGTGFLGLNECVSERNKVACVKTNTDLYSTFDKDLQLTVDETVDVTKRGERFISSTEYGFKINRIGTYQIDGWDAYFRAPRITLTKQFEVKEVPYTERIGIGNTDVDKLEITRHSEISNSPERETIELAHHGYQLQGKLKH